jgi:glutathione synthase
MRVLVQMDPIETMVVDRDTSLAFMLEAQKRGAELWWHLPADLYWDRGRVKAQMRRVRVFDDPARHYETLSEGHYDLADFDVVLIRQDPPFDMAYVANTYLLDLLPPRTLVLNNPRGVREISEKLATLHFPDLLAATLVGRNVAAIRAFASQFDQVVLKPSFFAGGDGVFKMRASDADFDARLMKLLTEVGKEPIIVQEFLPAIKDGDKRVFVVDGAAIGCVRRLPKTGDFRANLHVGGAAVGADLDARDHAIAAAVAPLLAKHGVLFAGLDVIDGRLTEINVTSPTLIRQLVAFGGPDIAALFWDKVDMMQRRGTS